MTKRSDNPVTLVKVLYTGDNHYSITLDYEDIEKQREAIDALRLLGGLSTIICELMAGMVHHGSFSVRADVEDGQLLLDERAI